LATDRLTDRQTNRQNRWTCSSH